MSTENETEHNREKTTKEVSIKDTLKEHELADVESGKSIVSINGVAIPLSQLDGIIVGLYDKILVSHVPVGG